MSNRAHLIRASILCSSLVTAVALAASGCGDETDTEGGGGTTPTGTGAGTGGGTTATGTGGGTTATGTGGTAGSGGGSAGAGGGTAGSGGGGDGGGGGGGPSNRWTDVFATADSIIAFHSNGNVYSWGANWEGLLGTGVDDTTLSESATPVQVCADTACTSRLQVSDVAEIDTSDWYVWLRKTDGTAWAWGHNRNGNFAGYGASGEWGIHVAYDAPVRMYADLARTNPLANLQDSAVGYQHNIFLDAAGAIRGQGWSNYTVDATSNYYQHPQDVKTAADFGGTAISAVYSGGFNSTFAVLSDGSVWAWGAEETLGDNHVTTTDSFDHKRVCAASDSHSAGTACTTFLSGVTQMIGFGDSTVQALLDTGKVVTWGRRANGAHGAGSSYPTTAYKPVEMTLTGTAVALASGTLGNTYHTLVALSTGALWASGGNWDGQLGNSDTNDVNLPVRVCADVSCSTYFAVDVAGITAGHNVIARGRNWSAAIRDDGTLWVWGDDGGSGVFGNGNLDEQSNIPVQVNFTP